MVVLDTTIVNLALPSLQREFHTIDGVEWVVTEAEVIETSSS